MIDWAKYCQLKMRVKIEPVSICGTYDNNHEPHADIQIRMSNNDVIAWIWEPKENYDVVLINGVKYNDEEIGDHAQNPFDSLKEIYEIHLTMTQF